MPPAASTRQATTPTGSHDAHHRLAHVAAEGELVDGVGQAEIAAHEVDEPGHDRDARDGRRGEGGADKAADRDPDARHGGRVEPDRQGAGHRCGDLAAGRERTDRDADRGERRR